MLIRTPACPICGIDAVLDVPEDGHHRWRSGDLIQDAMPGVPADVREQLVTGTHGACFDALFLPDEDEE